MDPNNRHCLVTILKNVGANPVEGDQGFYFWASASTRAFMAVDWIRFFLKALEKIDQNHMVVYSLFLKYLEHGSLIDRQSQQSGLLMVCKH